MLIQFDLTEGKGSLHKKMIDMHLKYSTRGVMHFLMVVNLFDKISSFVGAQATSDNCNLACVPDKIPLSFMPLVSLIFYNRCIDHS